LVLVVILQSSAAVGLLVAGFAGNATLGFGEGLAKTLGADLGSALLIQVLSFPLGLAGAFAAGNGGRDVLPVHGSQCETGGADHFGDRVYPDFLTVFARNHGPDPRKQFPARIGDISGARLRYDLHCRRIFSSGDAFLAGGDPDVCDAGQSECRFGKGRRIAGFGCQLGVLNHSCLA